MAGKRLVMAPSPGTGLFAQEPKARNKAKGADRYSREPPSDISCKSVAEQEEEKVNGRLVEILERKVAKLRSRAEEEEQKRNAAEQELQDVRDRLQDREQQVADLISAQRDLAEDRRVAAQGRAALEAIQKDCENAQRALQERELELKRLQEKSNKSDAAWKAQVTKLVGEMQEAVTRSKDLEAQLHTAKAENNKLTEAAQDLVRRYEEESSRRLELEDRCLSLEEKVKSREQRLHGDADAAQQKVKQSLQAKQRAEELSQLHDEKRREALQQAEEVESRCGNLEKEIERLRSVCAERGKRIQELQGSSHCSEKLPQSRQPDILQLETPQNSQLPPTGSGLPHLPPAPTRSRSNSRPGTAGTSYSAAAALSRPGTSAGSRPGSAASAASVVSRASSHNVRARANSLGTSSNGPTAPGGAAPGRPTGGYAQTGSSCHSTKSLGSTGENRLPPGAIRRAGSVPTRRVQGHSGTDSRSFSPGLAPAEATSTSKAAPQNIGRPLTGGSASGLPSARRSQAEVYCDQAAENEIDDCIPSDDDDDSSDEEVLTAVKVG
eukprot:TRINITY_DN97421_c0_g1_i1.p1 TRINITY_DN97421_c0_g1~~TRINITY_DN97421_c0_g1_i1.p1  ORF type:complete len:552 (-),score=152.17 TRINITY_DN97421_c0_g1_i1:56-1711(-)